MNAAARWRCLVVAFLGMGIAFPALADADPDADGEWKAILKSEQTPPAKEFANKEEARRVVLERLGQQEAALRAFIERHPLDERVFDANLRLARVLAVESDVKPDPTKFAESMGVLDAVERTSGLSRERRADLDFARLSLRMRRVRRHDSEARAWLTRTMRELQRKYPGDRRVARLMAEVASLYDADPKRKRELLQEAQKLAKEEELQLRIADDLKRLDLLGRRVPLEFESMEGRKVALSDFRGSVVAVCFFADWSPPSVAGLAELSAVLRKYPAADFRAVGISLDKSPESAKAVLKAANVTMPTMCDGRSWESPVVRAFGINALPTVWLFDREGRLRSLNARESLDQTVRALARDR